MVDDIHYPDQRRYEEILAELLERPALIQGEEIESFQGQLRDVMAGHALLLQVGECVEQFAWFNEAYYQAQLDFLLSLKLKLSRKTGRPVVMVGRMAGQFFKPRSRQVERIGGKEVSVYRGDGINGFDVFDRKADPERLLEAYACAKAYLDFMVESTQSVWTSHEALHTDFETMCLAKHHTTYAGSTHYPWLGMRHAYATSAQASFLSSITNPIAIKIGPELTQAELLQLLNQLNPKRRLARITLIYRFPLDKQPILLPRLFETVQQAGHPVLWCCDPVHGNTMRCENVKVRYVSTIKEVIVQAFNLHREYEVPMHGLHLEATSRSINECMEQKLVANDAYKNKPIIDPLFNARQALDIVLTWGELLAGLQDDSRQLDHADDYAIV